MKIINHMLRLMSAILFISLRTCFNELSHFIQIQNENFKKGSADCSNMILLFKIAIVVNNFERMTALKDML